MKFVFLATLIVGICSVTASQTAVPPYPGIRLQGTLTDNAGNLVTGSHNVTIRIFKAPATGVPIYTEVYNNLVFTNGILEVLVGATALPYDSLYYVETQLDNEVFSPRTQLASTPYVLHAFRSDTAAYAKAALPIGHYFNMGPIYIFGVAMFTMFKIFSIGTDNREFYIYFSALGFIAYLIFRVFRAFFIFRPQKYL